MNHIQQLNSLYQINMDKKLTTYRINNHHHKVLYGEKHIGYFIMDVDGYFYFDHITTNEGFWTSYSLRMIADLLDEMNKPYDDRLKDYFKNN